MAYRGHRLDRGHGGSLSLFSRVLVASARLAVAAVFLLPAEASAHVKGFAPTNVGEDPVPPIEIGIRCSGRQPPSRALALFMAGSLRANTCGAAASARMSRLRRTPGSFRPSRFLRIAVGGFFLSLWARGGVPADTRVVDRRGLDRMAAASPVSAPACSIGGCCRWAGSACSLSIARASDSTASFT